MKRLAALPIGGFTLRCGAVVDVRDMVEADAALYPEFHRHVSDRDRRLRFFSAATLSERQVFRLTHYDRRHAVARVAVGRSDGLLYGVSRLHRIEGSRGEFAVMVRTDAKGQGLGRRLMDEVIGRSELLGITTIVGMILPENAGMIALAHELGFQLGPEPGDPSVVRATLHVARSLAPAA